MKLSGSYKLNVNNEKVCKDLNDPKILKECIHVKEKQQKGKKKIKLHVLKDCFWSRRNEFNHWKQPLLRII